MKQYTFDELQAFIYRAENAEMCQQAREYIEEKVTYLSEADKAHLLMNLDDYEMNFWDDGYYDDRGSYSPTAPWNAPGMKVSDFITGVRAW